MGDFEGAEERLAEEELLGEAADAGDAWEDEAKVRYSNEIIICGQRVPLVQSAKGRSGAVKGILTGFPVLNFVDNKQIDFLNKETVNKVTAGGAKGIPSYDLVRPRGSDKFGKTLSEEETAACKKWLSEKLRGVVIHTDISTSSMSTFRGLAKRHLSSHFGINWNGVIYQYADIRWRAAHASDANDWSIGLDMNLFMFNLNGARAKKFLGTFKNLEQKHLQIAEAKIRLAFPGKSKAEVDEMLEDFRFEKPVSRPVQFGRPRAYGYTNRQYESLIALLKCLHREVKLKRSYPTGPDGQVISKLVSDEDKGKLEGMVAHWHLSASRWDPGPAFDWDRVLSALLHEGNYFPVKFAANHELRATKEIKKIDAAAMDLMRNYNEKARAGGTFPVGPNQTWHGGIHLFPPKSEKKGEVFPVRAMFPGEIVAVHFERGGPRALGHNNFVLLRHQIKIPRENRKSQEFDEYALTFYSLYMHLLPMDVSRDGARRLSELSAAKGRKIRPGSKKKKGKEEPEAPPETVGELAKKGTGPEGEALGDEKSGKKGLGVEWVQRYYQLSSLSKTDRKDKRAALQKQIVEAQQAFLNKVASGEDLGGDDDEETLSIVYEALDPEAEKESSRDDFLTMGAPGTLGESDKVTILTSEELSVPVSAGEVIGFIGEVMGAEGQRRPGVHVEVFGNKGFVVPIDLDLHAKHFRTPQRARGASPIVQTQDVLSVLRQGDVETYRPYGNLHIWPETRLLAESILDFYGRESSRMDDPTERYREQLRRSITYHVSEWSDRVDWISALTDGAGWSEAVKDSDFKTMVRREGLFSEEIRKLLPFVWLTEDVAKAVGLHNDELGDWDGRLYHVHPIRFILWVTFYARRRSRVFRTSVNLRKLRKRQAEESAMELLLRTGKEAKRKDAESGGSRQMADFQEALSKRYLAGRPPKEWRAGAGRWPYDFRLRKTRGAKRAKLTEEKDKLYAKILEDVRSEIDETGHEALGAIEPLEPTYAKPRDVLEDLYEITNLNEWRIERNPGSSGD